MQVTEDGRQTKIKCKDQTILQLVTKRQSARLRQERVRLKIVNKRQFRV